MTVMSVHNPNY